MIVLRTFPNGLLISLCASLKNVQEEKKKKNSGASMSFRLRQQFFNFNLLKHSLLFTLAVGKLGLDKRLFC